MEKNDEDKKVDNMIILYELSTGELCRVYSICDIPKDCNRIIIKDVEVNSYLTVIPKCKILVLSLGYIDMSNIAFECDILKVYNVKCSDFLLSPTSKVVELRHLDMRNIIDMDYSFASTSLRKICNLDFKNVKTATCVFANCEFEEIPNIRNYSHLWLMGLGSNNINQTKLDTWRCLIAINNNIIRNKQ